MNKKVMKYLILVFCFSFSFLLMGGKCYAAELSMSTLSVRAVEEEVFDLDIFIDPKGAESYTTVVELKYQPDFLEVVSFEFEDGWMSLPQPGYDMINNDKGVLIKTAGFPGGIKQKKKFGTIKFKTKKSGNGLIRVGDNAMSIGASNSDTLSRAFPTVVVVSGDSENNIPEQLFDINLEIDKTKVTDIEDMIFRVLFISFGSVPIPVDLSFIIIDEEGRQIHSEKDYVVVETEQVLEKKLRDLELSVGNYSLVLKTLYNQDVSDEFIQDFKIVEEELETSFYNTIWFWLLVVAPVLILLISLLKDRKRKR